MSAAATEETVTSETVIYDCLKQIADDNAPLTLTIQGGEDDSEYHSRIQSLNANKRQIVLKQVLPSDWREKISPTCKLEIKSFMNMGNIRFYGLLTALDDSENSPYCKLTLPKKIFRTQLRDYYRVSLATIHSEVVLHTADEVALRGSCRDISMSGALIALGNTDTKLEMGQSLECSICIDDILKLDFVGEVRSLHANDSETLAGLHFIDLSPAQQKPISSALSKIERQNIKH